MRSAGGDETNAAANHDEEGQLRSRPSFGDAGVPYQGKSVIGIHRIDSKHSIFHGEDPELVDVTLRGIRKADRNNDGQLDIDEVGLAILSAVKDAKKASKKEKNLKRIIGGLGGFLVVFAFIFLGVQGQSLSESINEAKITSINKDAYGHAHLQDKSSGSDLSTRSFGDKIIVESKLDLYSGRMLHCTSVGNVVAMTNDATNGVDANVVATTPEGLPAYAIPLSGEFADTQDSLHFGDDKVRVLMTSNACNTATADPQDEDDDDDTEGITQEEGGGSPFDRHLALRHSSLSSSVAVLTKNRQLYSMAMTAHHEGRVLTGDGSSLQVELPPWHEDKCTIMPADEQMVKESLDGIACPAMRFLIKKALQDGLFDLCGYGTDSYMVDTSSMKELLMDGVEGSAFMGLQRHKIMTNADNLSVMDRAFSGAIDSQSTGVLTHKATGNCINIQDYQYSSDTKLRPATSSGINLDNSCTGTRQRWKLRSSPDDPSIRIHHRRSADYCLSLNNAGTGVELNSCADAGDNAKWKLDSSGRINKWGGDGCLGVDASSNIILGGCNSEDASQVWTPPPILNGAHLEDNFDHSASSGIIGTATAASGDAESFNRDKYNEFLGKLCDCDPATLPTGTSFTESDFGRAVNHFGAAINDSTVRDSTSVGAFSWAILTFEWSNTFVAFKKNDVFPLSTFKALFLPDRDLIDEGMLIAATINTTFVPNIERDVLSDDEVHYLNSTISDMGIEISCDVKAAMDQAVADCDCASTPSCGACSFHGLFTDLCDVGYVNCVESGC